MRAPHLRAPHGARQGKFGVRENKKLMPPRERPAGAAAGIVTGGMGASAPISDYKNYSHGKLPINSQTLPGVSSSTDESVGVLKTLTLYLCFVPAAVAIPVLRYLLQRFW